MSKYTLIHKDENDLYGNNKNITITFESNNLPDVLDEIKYFLLGIGFHFNGNLQVVDDSEDEKDEE